MTLRELDAALLEKVFGWQWIQAPQWDYDGPLPEQGKVLVPPDHSPDYVWPPKGVISPHFFTGRYRFTTGPAASKQLREKIAADGFAYSLARNLESKDYSFHLWRLWPSHREDACRGSVHRSRLRHRHFDFWRLEKWQLNGLN